MIFFPIPIDLDEPSTERDLLPAGFGAWPLTIDDNPFARRVLRFHRNQSKLASAFSPVVLTPATPDPAWDGGKLHLPPITSLNGQRFGAPQAEST